MTRQSTMDLLPDLESRLSTTSARSLLATYASLTHQIDASARELRDLGTYGNLRQRHAEQTRGRGLRAQRNLVEAECLRRMGGE